MTTKKVGKHDRIEIRQCWTISGREYIEYIRQHERWPKLEIIVLVESERIIDGQSSKELRYGITSLPYDAKMILKAVRAHWQVENTVHWVLDVVFL